MSAFYHLHTALSQPSGYDEDILNPSPFLQALFEQSTAVASVDSWTLEDMEAAARRYEAVLQPLIEHALTDQDFDWIETALREGGPCGFFAVEVIRRKDALREQLFPLLLRAGIDECDPSANRSYIEPLVSRFGLRRVLESLLDVFERGGVEDKAGALNALYWAQAPLTFKGEGPLTIENATVESRALYLAVEDLRRRRDVLFLRAFVDESDVSLRRCLLARMSLDAADYPAELAPLVEKAQRLARDGF